MDPERWRQIDDLFYDALQQTPNERDSILAAACAGDDVLRREAESLLEASAQAGDFMEMIFRIVSRFFPLRWKKKC